MNNKLCKKNDYCFSPAEIERSGEISLNRRVLKSVPEPDLNGKVVNGNDIQICNKYDFPLSSNANQAIHALQSMFCNEEVKLYSYAKNVNADLEVANNNPPVYWYTVNFKVSNFLAKFNNGHGGKQRELAFKGLNELTQSRIRTKYSVKPDGEPWVCETTTPLVFVEQWHSLRKKGEDEITIAVNADIIVDADRNPKQAYIKKPADFFDIIRDVYELPDTVEKICKVRQLAYTGQNKISPPAYVLAFLKACNAKNVYKTYSYTAEEFAQKYELGKYIKNRQYEFVIKAFKECVLVAYILDVINKPTFKYNNPHNLKPDRIVDQYHQLSGTFTLSKYSKLKYGCYQKQEKLMFEPMDNIAKGLCDKIRKGEAPLSHIEQTHTKYNKISYSKHSLAQFAEAQAEAKDIGYDWTRAQGYYIVNQRNNIELINDQVGYFPSWDLDYSGFWMLERAVATDGTTASYWLPVFDCRSNRRNNWPEEDLFDINRLNNLLNAFTP